MTDSATFSHGACDLCREEVGYEHLEKVARYYCRNCAAAHDLDVPLCKAATESIVAELEMRYAPRLPPGVVMYTITPAEKDILDAAKALSCKPVRRIENGFDPDGPESMPAPAGMMTLGGRGQIRKVCEAVIRWRAANEDSGPEGVAAKESSKDIATPEGATNSPTDSRPGGAQDRAAPYSETSATPGPGLPLPREGTDEALWHRAATRRGAYISALKRNVERARTALLDRRMSPLRKVSHALDALAGKKLPAEEQEPEAAAPFLIDACQRCGRCGPLRLVGIRTDFAGSGEDSTHGGEQYVCLEGCKP